MSDEQEKKPAKSRAKKATASGEKVKASKPAAKVKAAPAATKKAAPKAKTAVKSAVAAGIPEVLLKSQPTHEEIAARAYGYFLERNGQHGFHEQDWFRAELELLGIS